MAVEEKEKDKERKVRFLAFTNGYTKVEFTKSEEYKYINLCRSEELFGHYLGHIRTELFNKLNI